MKYNFTALNDIRLLPETLEQLKLLGNESLTFPTDQQTTEEELIKRTGDAEAILISPWAKITESYLNACPSVKYIGISGTSTANVDLEACNARNISVTNVKDYADEPTAELIIMRLTALVRGMGEYQWKEMPRELMGKSIGIIGLGALGKEIAHLALAHRMDVNYYSTHRKPDLEEQGLKYLELHDLLRSSEIVVISTPANIKILGEEEFSLLQPNSILIQATIECPFDQDAFLNWIKKDENYFICDYGVGEENYQRYKDIPRVLIIKTTSGFTYETRQRLGQRVIENLKSYFEKDNVQKS